jgi:hypothetical protein
MTRYLNELLVFLRKKYEDNEIVTLFAIAMSIFLAAFLILGFVTGGETIYHMLWKDSDKTFSDFFDSIFYSNDMPYTKWQVIYPPLVTVFYDFLGDFITPFVNLNVSDPSHALRDSQMGLMIYGAITVITLGAMRILFKRVLENDDVLTKTIFILIVFSYPVIYAIERGNNILIAMLFSLLFLILYNSENRRIRYLSYVFLSLAAGFKIYPLILGLLILREKRYKEAIVCALIGTALLLLPFILTDGNLFILIENIFSYSKDETPFGFINIDQFIRVMLNQFLMVRTIDIIIYLVYAAMYAFVLYIVLINRDIPRWKIIALLCCAIILGPGVGTQYLFVYMLIPLFFFLRDERNLSTWNKFYLICFVVVMALIPGAYTADGAWTVVISSVKSVFIFLMMAGLVYEGTIGHLLRNRSEGVPTSRKEDGISVLLLRSRWRR